MSSILAFGMPVGVEWIIILVVALLLFGSRLPKIMRGMGSSVREFREGMDKGEDAAAPADAAAVKKEGDDKSA